MRRRVPTIRRLITQYQRYLRKLQRIESGHSRSNGREWLIKRIEKIKQKLILRQNAGQLYRRSLAAGTAFTLSLPLMIAQNTQQEYLLTNNNPVTDFVIGEDAHPVFVDFDGDGDEDMFLGGESSDGETAEEEGLHYYQNNGGSFTRVIDGPFPADLGIAALLDTVSFVEINPAFVDFDTDGDMDAFIGLGEGGIRYFRNDGGAMVADESQNPFTVSADSAFIQDALSPALGDVDGDGDHDLVLGSGGDVDLYLNDNGVFAEVDAISSSDGLSSESPVLYDYDADGDLDLIVGNKYGEVSYYENNGGLFAEQDDHPISAIDVGSYISPAVTDLDGDGDADILIGSDQGGIIYFRNDGENFSRVTSNELGLYADASEARPALYDYDGDGDMDAFIGDASNVVVLWENDGGSFAKNDANNPFGSISFEADVIPSFADFDGDGDTDLIASYYGSSDSPELFLNTDGVYTEVTDTLQNPLFKITESDAQAWTFHDLDNDGDVDGLMGNKYGTLEYFENNNGVWAEAAVNPFENIDVGGYSVPTLADYDGDGDVDLIVGNGDGELTVFAGDGGFPLEEIPATFDGMNFLADASPAVGDVDGDGDMDILVGNDLGEIFLLENVTEGVSTTDLSDESVRMRVFPNPATNRVQIEAPWAGGDAVLQLHDAQGRLLLQRRFDQSLITLRVEQLPKGLYTIKVSDEISQGVKSLLIR